MTCPHVGIGDCMPDVECCFCEIEKLREQLDEATRLLAKMVSGSLPTDGRDPVWKRINELTERHLR